MIRLLRPGRFDHAELRQSIRKGRERGCSVYIAGAELAKAGIDPDAPAPKYRVWVGQRGRFIVTLYTAPSTEGSTTA